MDPERAKRLAATITQHLKDALPTGVDVYWNGTVDGAYDSPHFTINITLSQSSQAFQLRAARQVRATLEVDSSEAPT